MFDIETENIARIVERVIGNPRHETNIETWTTYNCPYCADYEGVESDGKYNCCVNYREGYFHCWKCGTAGKISRILKDYGGKSVVGEYYKELESIKKSQEYQLYKNNALVKSELIETDELLKLPENYRRISSADKESYGAYMYLKNRGLDYGIINDFEIGYVPWSDDYKMRTRIVIPSYDQYRNLNYYVTRDYSGKQKLKYINPNIDKKTIIFNEGKVNWGDNIILCEGVFDSFVLPNSIPLLGKVLNEDFAVYQALTEKARAKIVVLLDDDAINDAKKMYRFLNTGVLKDRIRLIECPNGYDASLFYEKFGKQGIYKLIKSARKLEEYELL
jgi:DNA primase